MAVASSFSSTKLLSLIQISTEYVPMDLIYNKPVFVQNMTWRRANDRPLHEPLMT